MKVVFALVLVMLASVAIEAWAPHDTTLLDIMSRIRQRQPGKAPPAPGTKLPPGTAPKPSPPPSPSDPKVAAAKEKPTSKVEPLFGGGKTMPKQQSKQTKSPNLLTVKSKAAFTALFKDDSLDAIAKQAPAPVKSEVESVVAMLKGGSTGPPGQVQVAQADTTAAPLAPPPPPPGAAPAPAAAPAKNAQVAMNQQKGSFLETEDQSEQPPARGSGPVVCRWMVNADHTPPTGSTTVTTPYEDGFTLTRSASWARGAGAHHACYAYRNAGAAAAAMRFAQEIRGQSSSVSVGFYCTQGTGAASRTVKPPAACRATVYVAASFMGNIRCRSESSAFFNGNYNAQAQQQAQFVVQQGNSPALAAATGPTSGTQVLISREAACGRGNSVTTHTSFGVTASAGVTATQGGERGATLGVEAQFGRSWDEVNNDGTQPFSTNAHVRAPATMVVAGPNVELRHNVIYATLTSNARCENNADGRTITESSANTDGFGIYTAMIAEGCPMGTNPAVGVHDQIIFTTPAANTEMTSVRNSVYQRALGPDFARRANIPSS